MAGMSPPNGWPESVVWPEEFAGVPVFSLLEFQKESRIGGFSNNGRYEPSMEETTATFLLADNSQVRARYLPGREWVVEAIERTFPLPSVPELMEAMEKDGWVPPLAVLEDLLRGVIPADPPNVLTDYPALIACIFGNFFAGAPARRGALSST